MNKRECGISIINNLAMEFSLSPEESGDLCELLLRMILQKEEMECVEYGQMKLDLLQRGDSNFCEALFEFERRLSGEMALEA